MQFVPPLPAAPAFLMKPQGPFAEHSADEPLTQREVEILAHVAAGNANKEIAVKPSIAEETVKTHMGNILSKLAAKDRTHAVMIGIRRGIIDP